MDDRKPICGMLDNDVVEINNISLTKPLKSDTIKYKKAKITNDNVKVGDCFKLNGLSFRVASVSVAKQRLIVRIV